MADGDMSVPEFQIQVLLDEIARQARTNAEAVMHLKTQHALEMQNALNPTEGGENHDASEEEVGSGS